jgi:hypothetical protein
LLMMTKATLVLLMCALWKTQDRHAGAQGGSVRAQE